MPCYIPPLSSITVDAVKRLCLRTEIHALQEELDSTDWYVIRKMENGTPIPDAVIAARQVARTKISHLRQDLAALCS